MAVTGFVFPQFAAGAITNQGTPIILNGGGTHTYKFALGNAAGPITEATAGISTAKTFTDWKAIVAEISGAGYTAGGVTLAGTISFTQAGTNNATGTFTATTNPSWTTATFTANQAVLYDSTATTFQLIAFWDFGGAIPVSAGTFTLTINGSGLMTTQA